MKSIATFCLVLFACALSLAQQKPVASVVPASAPAPIASPLSVQASAESENAILKAEHSLDQIKSDESELASQFDKLQRQAEQLTARYKADKDKEPSLTAAVNDAVESAWKASGLPKDKYSFDPTNFTFAKKPEAKAPAIAKVEVPKTATK